MKHTVEFKQTAVEDYLKGVEGYKLVARRYGVAGAMLRRWALWYQNHGVDGLTSKSGQYDVGFKMSVLQHMWDNALSYTQVAAVFNVRNTQSIASWDRRYRDGGVLSLQRSQRPSRAEMKAPTVKPDSSPPDDDKGSHEDLLKEIEFLRMENAYLKKVDALLQARQNSTAPKKRK